MTMKDLTPNELNNLVEKLASIRETVKTTRETVTLTDAQKEHNKPIDAELRKLRATVETLESNSIDVPGQESVLNDALTELIDLVSLQEVIYKASSKLHNEAKYTLDQLNKQLKKGVSDKAFEAK
jgi:hypothetical protein